MKLLQYKQTNGGNTSQLISWVQQYTQHQNQKQYKKYLGLSILMSTMYFEMSQNQERLMNGHGDEYMNKFVIKDA